MTLAVLLRGINVGRSGRVTMVALRNALSRADVEVAATVVQSGNLVVRNWSLSADQLATQVSAVILAEFAIRSRALVRTPKDLRAIVQMNPLASLVTNEAMMNIHFVEPRLTNEQWHSTGLVELDPHHLAIAEGTLFQWCPHGLSKAPTVSSQLERALGVTVTVRNIRTVRRLFEACQ